MRFFANSDDPSTTLIVGTASSQTNPSSFTPLDTVIFTTADTYQEVIIPITTANGYNGTDQFVVLSHDMNNTYDYIRIDEFNYEVIPPCPKVTGINLTNATTNTFTIDFSSSGTSYDLEWGPTGYTQGTGCFATVNTTSPTVTNTLDPNCGVQLIPNTYYDVYVRNNCNANGDGTSIWAGPFTVKTACAAFTAPYYNGLESEPQDAPPICWAGYATNSATWVEVEDFTGTSAPYAGTQALYMYSSSASPTSDTLMSISPQFSDLTSSDKQLRFFANSDDPSSQLIVGTVADHNSPSTFSPIDTITFPTADTYQEVIVEFSLANGYNGTHEYIALAHGLGGTFDYVRMDEFNYELIPACAPPLSSSLGVTGTTSNTASIFWGSGSDGDETHVEWGTVGFTPGTGTQISSDSVAGNIDTYTITGLTPQTTYEFYIKDSCAASGFSPWVGPISFTTSCLSSTLPYFEDFGTYTSFPTCWTRSHPTDVSLETSCASNSNVIQIRYTEDAVSPNIDVSGTSSLQVAYQIGAGACNNNPENEDFIVEYWDGSQWVEARRYNGNQMPNAFVGDDFILPSSAYSNIFKLRFNQLQGTTDTWQFDSVSVKQGPSCFAPTNLTATGVIDTSATLNWGSVPNAGTYQVWFGPQGFFQGTQSSGGVKVFTTTDSLVVDTLTGLTCYDYLVRAICGPGDTTAWVGPVNFCTQCAGLTPMTLPFFDGFESFNTTITQGGTYFCGPSYSYAMEDPGGSGEILFNYNATSGPSTPYNGTRSAGLTSLSSSDPVFMIFTADLSAYAGTPNLQMLLSFYFADHFDETGVDDKVWARGQQGDTWIEILDWNSANATTNWQKFEIRLDSVFAANSQSFSSSTQIRWGQMDNASMTGGDGFSIDDLSLMATTCPQPTNLSVSNATQTSVDLSWTTGGAPGVVIEYGPPGFTLGTGQTTQVTGSSPYTLTGLSAGTPYEFYIRDSCGTGDLSFYTGPAGDTTLCANVLSGVYTIGGSSASYPTFADAANALNLCGISAPVTFNVNPGYYTDRLHLYNVPGASSTNTITFAGSGSDTLVWDGMGDQAAVLVSGTPYVTVTDMVIMNGAPTEAWGVLLTNNADHFTISNSYVGVDSSGSFASDVVPFLVSGATDNDFTFGADVDSVSIDNCEIVGGYHGIQVYGNSTTSNVSGLSVVNSNIRKFYISGMYLYSIDGVELINNTIVSDISVTDEDGIYAFDIYNYNIEANQVSVKDYGIYISDGNDGTTPTTNSRLVNNMVLSANDYGIYLNDVIYTNVYHNTSVGSPGMAINDDEDLDIINNIFVSDADYAFESFDPLDASTTIDYNVYYRSGTGDLLDIGVNTYTNLAAWVSADATRNANSLEGDPLFISSTDLHLIGGLANDVGDNSLGITVDIDGDVRPAAGSTTVDIGADEYTPPAGDLALIGGDFIKGLCLSTNDSIVLMAQNLVTPMDFSVNPLTFNYNVTGPVNSSGSFTINSGNLNILDTLIAYAGNIDLSQPGTYTLQAYIDSNAVNVLTQNDTIGGTTIDVLPEFRADPKVVTLASANDSTEICIESSFFGGGGFLFTEVSHFSATGAGTVPAYVPDDYIEITGVPGSDLDGITLEVWTGTSAVVNYTFPTGTVIGPNGTAIIMQGQGATASQPANFIYDGRGSYTGLFSSGSVAGYVLKDGSDIMDAVAYNGYTFPAASGVTSADWTGSLTGTGGTAGIRATGPDINSDANWTVVSAQVTQDAQVLNPGVSLPRSAGAPGFAWFFGGTQIDTSACIMVGPYASAGTYQYIANYSNACGTFSDTVTVIIPTCSAPSNLVAGTGIGSSIGVGFDTTGTGASSFDIQYGPTGFAFGTGTTISVSSDTTTITGLAMNLCQDVYVRSSCGPTDTSTWIGPISACPEESICTDDIEQYSTGLIEGQSSLFLPWQGIPGAGGSASVVTTQSASGSQSIMLSNPSGSATTHDDIVAYFDTISSGAWEVSFELFVPTGRNAYYNIQQNHDFTGANNLWGGEIYFQGNGVAEVNHSNPAVVVGTFPYTQNQWNTVTTIIDLDNDSIWFELNGTSTGIGYDYSSANFGQPLQFNGVNFFTGEVVGDATSSEFYIDDFCVTPATFGSNCLPVNQVQTSNVGCDELTVSWLSNTGGSIIEYGPSPLTPGTGTFSGIVTSPHTLTSLTPGTAYEVRVADTCGADTSAYRQVPVATASGPLPNASFTIDSAIVGGVYNVYLNAGSSTGATSYSWDFGNGTTGSNIADTVSYNTNGSYTITLVVTNACGSDTATFTTNANVGLDENALDRTLDIFPNPANNVVNVSFNQVGSGNVYIRLADAQGRTVMELSDKLGSSTYTKALDVSKLAAGVYMVEVSSGDMAAIRRISISK